MTTNEQVTVVGAGVSGLTTAVCLAEAGIGVRVVADVPPQETTSVVAGAMWGPCFLEPMGRTLGWTETSLAEFTALAGDPGTGVRLAPTLTVGAMPGTDLPPQVRLVPELRPARPGELPDGYASGFAGRMPVIDMPRYLEYLTARLARAGVTVEQRRVASLTDEGPLVVNCAGLGARGLAGDADVRPDFGQEVVLSNPGLDRVFIDLTPGAETIIIPHADRVLCGMTSDPGRRDTTPGPDATARILDRCRAAEPRLRDAEVLDVLTGLRPSRPAVRVEPERIDGVHVVHNYGHGGYGVCLSWGCARDVVPLVTDESGRPRRSPPGGDHVRET